jgi:rhodanese-related sulfurtransferase
MKTLAALVLLTSVAAAADAFGELTVDQVEAKLTQKNVFVYDCNPPDVYRDAHLPGAKLLLNYSRFAASDLPADKTATLIFYCANEH